MVKRGRPLQVPDWVHQGPDTGVKQLWRWVLHEGSVSTAATEIGWSYSRLHSFLTDPRKGIGARAAVELSKTCGIPPEALILKNKPLTELTTPWVPPEDELDWVE